jgi:hypothetical protein
LEKADDHFQRVSQRNLAVGAAPGNGMERMRKRLNDAGEHPRLCEPLPKPALI